MRTTFEWASKITKDNKTKDFIGMYVAIKIGKIDCYMQLDLGCPHTFLMEDFIKNYIPEFENKKKSDLDWYGKGMPHLENIKLTLAKGKINSLKYCFIEKDLTKKETKNEETILKKKLPFAGFLGMDFFEGMNFFIDFKNQTLGTFKHSIAWQRGVSEFQFKKQSIIIPTKINNTAVDLGFDTATGDSFITFENNLFKKIFNTGIKGKPSRKIDRPDFMFRNYMHKAKIKLELNHKVYKRYEMVETPERKANRYFFSYSHKAIIGNLFFRDKKISFDFKNRLYQIT